MDFTKSQFAFENFLNIQNMYLTDMRKYLLDIKVKFCMQRIQPLTSNLIKSQITWSKIMLNCYGYGFYIFILTPIRELSRPKQSTIVLILHHFYYW